MKFNRKNRGINNAAILKNVIRSNKQEMEPRIGSISFFGDKTGSRAKQEVPIKFHTNQKGNFVD
ncbi:MAG: hypothetical protein SO160_04345 [Lachnospiraceae bacterium]|nr:hypothetical protein [Lachnospiraceae bacterium]